MTSPDDGDDSDVKTARPLGRLYGDNRHDRCLRRLSTQAPGRDRGGASDDHDSVGADDLDRQTHAGPAPNEAPEGGDDRARSTPDHRGLDHGRHLRRGDAAPAEQEDERR